MIFKISNEANNDLENIWLYTFETWSIDQADRYFNLILDEIEHLSKNPTIGNDVSYIRKGYFRSKVNTHFIFYRINNEKQEIEIIRILHEQMDIDSHL
jgi:toxin ParE1/3/4